MKSFALSIFQSLARFWRTSVETRQEVVYVDPGDVEDSINSSNRGACGKKTEKGEEADRVDLLGSVGWNFRRLLQEHTLESSVLLIKDGYWPSPLSTSLPFYFCQGPPFNWLHAGPLHAGPLHTGPMLAASQLSFEAEEDEEETLQPDVIVVDTFSPELISSVNGHSYRS